VGADVLLNLEDSDLHYEDNHQIEAVPIDYGGGEGREDYSV